MQPAPGDKQWYDDLKTNRFDRVTASCLGTLVGLIAADFLYSLNRYVL